MSDSEKFWFNTKTNQVEFGLKSSSIYRIGPFATEEEASRAIEIVSRRAKEIREQELLED
jgi:hypothetical protein